MSEAPHFAEDLQQVQPAGEWFLEQCPPEVALAGHSDAMRELLSTVRIIAASGLRPVLILGETGTGKELVARALHASSARSGEQFVAVNCASLSEQLLESELFGHVKGAFTGADRDKTGLFELAGRGTLFLDEISEIPLSLQAKLLRALQEQSFRKVGGTEELPCEATVVASSNRDLAADAAKGTFRQDLYFRLAVFPVVVAPLRSPARRQDIALLADYFLEHSTLTVEARPVRLDTEALRRLMEHSWPGNVRELRNVMDRAILLADGAVVTAASIRFDSSFQPQSSPAQPPRPEDFSLETAEREFILRALKETNWQRNRAAGLLGITRTTLYAKLKRYDIQLPEDPPVAPHVQGDPSEAAEMASARK